ncbi:DNA photolyase, FAD-binding/Cryptochrome, partial [Rozella allomycis CSF55]
IRECLNEALIANKGLLDSGNEGAVTWISELCWREFYRHVLFHYPRVCMYQPFKLETKNIKWRDDPEGFEKWCKGETGYPIVDAGMRQLNKTGWMHNRSRMIAAMFLTKDLLIDWRKGEKYFMENLIDGDFASNNGGWQWSASTGTDSQPYFRVFNPLLQSQKNDPDGVFIKKWVPELKGLNKKQIHCPKDCLGASEFKKLNYPLPLVDHDMARKRAIDAFKNLKTDEEPKSAY